MHLSTDYQSLVYYKMTIGGGWGSKKSNNTARVVTSQPELQLSHISFYTAKQGSYSYHTPSDSTMVL